LYLTDKNLVWQAEKPIFLKKSLGTRCMSPGFKIKSVDAKKSSGTVKNPKAVVEIGVIQESLVKHFGGLKDSRVEGTKKHQLTDILVITILAIISGASGMGRHRELRHQ